MQCMSLCVVAADKMENELVQEYTSLANNQPRKHLHEIQPTSNEPDPKRRWFAKPLSPTQVYDCCKPLVPKNTQKQHQFGCARI